HGLAGVEPIAARSTLPGGGAMQPLVDSIGAGLEHPRDAQYSRSRAPGEQTFQTIALGPLESVFRNRVSPGCEFASFFVATHLFCAPSIEQVLQNVLFDELRSRAGTIAQVLGASEGDLHGG